MPRSSLPWLLLLAGLLPGAAGASPIAWEGTFALQLVGYPALSVDVSGVGVAIDTGNGVTLRTLRPLGTSGGTATQLVTDPESISSQLFAVQLQVDALGFGTLSPFRPPAPSTQPQLAAAQLPVHGVLRFCFLDSSCTFAADLPLSTSRGAVGVGVGGVLAGSHAGLTLSLEAAPWTVRTASVTVLTDYGARITLVTAGSLHGAHSFTGSTAIPGGELSLVTPLRVHSSLGPPTAAFGRLSIRFLPEPGLLLLLGTGLCGLGALHRLRHGVGR